MSWDLLLNDVHEESKSGLLFLRHLLVALIHLGNDLRSHELLDVRDIIVQVLPLAVEIAFDEIPRFELILRHSAVLNEVDQDGLSLDDLA